MHIWMTKFLERVGLRVEEHCNLETRSLKLDAKISFLPIILGSECGGIMDGGWRVCEAQFNPSPTKTARDVEIALGARLFHSIDSTRIRTRDSLAP